MEKRFDEWNIVKQKLHKNAIKPNYHNMEIWWCAVGENIGIEMNGKSERFSRPVLIIRKYGPDGFLGVPISSQTHEGIWYKDFIYKKRRQTALLSQVRTFSVQRLYKKIGRISYGDYISVVNSLQELLFKNNIPQS